MRIGIDARPLVGGQRTGVGNYVYGLIQQLPDIAPEHDYFLYSNRPILDRLPDTYVRRHASSTLGRWSGFLWLLIEIGRAAARDNLDVFWSTATLLPPGIPNTVRKVVTVYDFVWLRFPETMKASNLWLHRFTAERAIRNCDRMIAISRSTGSDVTHFLGIPSERIRLVYPGISEAYKLQDPVSAATQFANKFNIPPRYMAAVGTIEPRKNLGLLVRALKLLKQNGRLNCPLVIAGTKGWKNSLLNQQIQDARLSENDIKFLGYVPDEDLPLFYAGAQVFLFPSLYEGFGIPPLEAMACGTPVIASDAQPMPEVLGDAAILEPPCSPERFAEAISSVLTDARLRCSMRERGQQRVREFSWKQSTRQLLDALCSP
jgi:glycosyltransferase involved in cell wall biosynthesis